MSCGHWWLAEVNEMLLDFISTLFCWRLSVVETLIEWLIVLKRVVNRKEWWRSLCWSLQHVTAQTRNRSWSRPLESMLVSGLYQHVSESSQKRLCNAFIQQSVMPLQRLSKRQLLFEFPGKKKILLWYTCTEPKDPYWNGSVWIVYRYTLIGQWMVFV